MLNRVYQVVSLNVLITYIPVELHKSIIFGIPRHNIVYKSLTVFNSNKRVVRLSIVL
jgi:hypothetical protein